MHPRTLRYHHSTSTNPPSREAMVAFWAFGAYFCMYGLRKPFTAGSYDTATNLDIPMKALLVAGQTLGYVISKWLGIRLVSAIKDKERVPAIFGLIMFAQISLLGFAFAPYPLNIVMLFLNGLPLGMIFGLIVRFLEGRRATEAMIAGLCASFILADGFAKTVGTVFLSIGVGEKWMPFWSGIIFLIPLFLFTHELGRTAPPSIRDLKSRRSRPPMLPKDRKAFLRIHTPTLQFVLAMYVIVTILRGLRADFAPEYWKIFGRVNDPFLFSSTEILVAILVLALNALMVKINGHKLAFRFALLLSFGGMALLAGINLFLNMNSAPWAYMTMAGLGLYLPYVAVHTTLFERMVALEETPSNIGYPMYLADSAGYTAYFVVMILPLFKLKAVLSLEHIRTLFLYSSIAGLVLIILTFISTQIKSIHHDRNDAIDRKSHDLRRERHAFPLDPSAGT